MSLRDVISPKPSPSEAAQADDRLDRLIAGRSQREVDVIQSRRLGLTFEEIAAQTGVKERTARRIIDSAWGRDGGVLMDSPESSNAEDPASVSPEFVGPLERESCALATESESSLDCRGLLIA